MRPRFSSRRGASPSLRERLQAAPWPVWMLINTVLGVLVIGAGQLFGDDGWNLRTALSTLAGALLFGGSMTLFVVLGRRRRPGPSA